MPRSREGWAAVISFGVSVGLSVTPGIQNWWLAGIAWTVTLYALWRWYRHSQPQASTSFDGKFFQQPPKPVDDEWLDVKVETVAIGPGAKIDDEGHHETSVSLGVRIINRHPTNKYSLDFAISNADATKTKGAAPQFEAQIKGLREYVGKNFFPPLAISPQTEQVGYLWFFAKLPPNQMPINKLLVKDSISKTTWETPITQNPKSTVEGLTELYKLPLSKPKP